MLPALGEAIGRGIVDVRMMGHYAPMPAILPLTMHFLGTSVRDIALRVTGHGRNPEQTTVRQVMTGTPVHISVDSTLHELTARLHKHHARRVPILNESGRAIGIVTIDDLLALLGNEMSDMGKALSKAFFHKAAVAEVEPEEFHWWVLP